MLRVQMQEDHFSTLDICSVDLKNACVRLVKAGGIKSFIRHRGFVEQVGEHTLPLGLIGEEQIEMHERFLESGDMVILLSDGILHDWNGGDCMTQLQEVIMQSEVFTPQELANRILRCAITQSHGNIRDDMTVMVLGIWKK